MMTTGQSMHVTLDELDKWFASAEPGDVLIYCRGDLATDRTRGLILPELANRILSFADHGHAYLFQRRHGYWDFEYRMMRARKRAVRAAPPMLAIGSELVA